LIGLILTITITLGLMALIGFVLHAPVDLALGLFLGILIYPAMVAVGVSQIGSRQMLGGRYWYALVGAYGAVLLLVFISPGFYAFAVVVSEPVGMGLLVALLTLLPPITASLRYRYLARRLDIMDAIDDDEFDLSAYQESGWEDY
jgi:hypothetical protein